MKRDEITSAGNRFAITFLLAFLFIYVAVIQPHFDPQNKDSQLASYIGNGQREIRILQRKFHSRMDKIANRLHTMGVRTEPAPRIDKGAMIDSDSDACADPESLAAALPEAEKLCAEMTALGEKIAKNEVDYINLEKTKPSRQFTVPPFSAALDEELILTLFPAIVLLSLIRLSLYRRELLRNLPAGARVSLPLWAAPVPYGRFHLGRREWFTVNAGGLCLACVILMLVLAFLAEYADSPEKADFAAVQALLVAGAFVWILILVLSTAFARQEPAE